jgi:hypothetical protein
MSALATAPITGRISETNLKPSTVKREQIAKLAYVLWEQRGSPYGSPEVDWLEAERELEESSYVSR